MNRAMTALALAAAMALPAAAQIDADIFSVEKSPATIVQEAFEGGTQSMPGVDYSLGATAGYLKVKGADDATWFAGISARANFAKMFGAEASVVFHQAEYADGDITVTDYPVQLTGIFFPPLGELSGVKPYALVGLGWYYSRIEYDPPFSDDSETTNSHGIHIGVGAELPLGGSLVGYVDVRYVFIDDPGVDNSVLKDEEFDFWEIALGVNFRM